MHLYHLREAPDISRQATNQAGQERPNDKCAVLKGVTWSLGKQENECFTLWTAKMAGENDGVELRDQWNDEVPNVYLPK